MWTQATLADFLATGEMDRHVRRSGLRYRARRDRLVAELAAHLPGWSVSGTAAGLHLLVRLPPGSDEAAPAALAQQCALDSRPLGHYSVGDLGSPGLVIGYGHQSPDGLTAAVAALARQAR